MNLTLGWTGLAVGLGASLWGIVAMAVGVRTENPNLLRLSRPIASGVMLGALVAFIAMERAILTNDTSVRYVAEHSSSTTPFPFDVATLWGALEGSILLWTLILCGYTLAITQKYRRKLDDHLVAWAMLVLFVICAFFFALTLGPAAPFQHFDAPAGFDGPGPNPLLQNHILMVFHPPILYLGYVGFSVPFAFAIAALITGRVGEGWLRETRRWTLVAWGFLSVGIVLGSWWSYEVLGWGGVWAWDAVENASLLPWLCATAYIHSVMVQERRGLLRVWNLSLLCATFSLTILGTFLTRSGVIDSVHAFSNSTIGPILLAFFGAIVAVSLGLIWWRADALRSPGAVDSPISREGAFVANNLLFTAFAFVVLLGTVFPLIVEAANGDRISVGSPYFDRMTMPIGFMLLFIMGVAPVLPWRKASGEVLRDRLWWPGWVAVGSLILAIAVGARGWAPLLAFVLGGFGIGSAARQLVLAMRRQGLRGLFGRATGGMVVHIGIIIIAVAFVASTSYDRQGEFSLQPGDTVSVGGHTFRYEGFETVGKENKREIRVKIRIDGGQVFEPSSNQYFSQSSGQTIPTPSVDGSPREDLYLNLTRVPTESDPSIGLRVIVRPLVMWIWIGGFIVAVGTVLALFPGRRRDPLSPVSSDPDLRRGAAPPAPAGAGEPVLGEPPDAEPDDELIEEAVT